MARFIVLRIVGLVSLCISFAFIIIAIILPTWQKYDGYTMGLWEFCDNSGCKALDLDAIKLAGKKMEDEPWGNVRTSFGSLAVDLQSFGLAVDHQSFGVLIQKDVEALKADRVLMIIVAYLQLAAVVCGVIQPFIMTDRRSSAGILGVVAWIFLVASLCLYSKKLVIAKHLVMFDRDDSITGESRAWYGEAFLFAIGGKVMNTVGLILMSIGVYFGRPADKK